MNHVSFVNGVHKESIWDEVIHQQETYGVHVDQPSFLPWALGNSRKPELLVNLIVQFHLFESFRELSAVFFALGLGFRWCTTSPSTSSSATSTSIVCAATGAKT